ncbi:MAG: hypothetical protein AB7T06_40310 [Kofleriaceae bacterium]
MTRHRWALGIAFAIIVGFALLHALGGREYVGILSGTLPAGELDLVAGLAYAAAWFAVVLVAPILVLAVIVDCGYGTLAKRLHRWRASRRHSSRW